MKKHLLVLLAWNNILVSGGTTSSLLPSQTEAAQPTLEQLQAELAKHKHALTILQQRMAQLTAAAQEKDEIYKPPAESKYTFTFYYRPKHDQNDDAWKPVTPAYPLDRDDRHFEYASVMRSPEQKPNHHEDVIHKLETYIKALQNRIRTIEAFLSKQNPATFNPMDEHTT